MADFRSSLIKAGLATPLAFAAVASQAAPLSLDSHILVERREAPGRHVVENAPSARSGDRLLFLVRYRNGGAATLRNYAIVSPVPAGVRILTDRADQIRVSADGGRSWSRPDALFRVDASGRLKPAPDAQPTHVRLRLDHPLAPGEAGSITYRGELL